MDQGFSTERPVLSATLPLPDYGRVARQPPRAMDLLADISLTLPKVTIGYYDSSDDYIRHRSV